MNRFKFELGHLVKFEHVGKAQLLLTDNFTLRYTQINNGINEDTVEKAV